MKGVRDIKFITHSEYYSLGVSEPAFTTDGPDLQDLINQLDMFDERQNEAIRSAMHQAGNLICEEQKRLAPFDYLKDAITVGQLRVQAKENKIFPWGKPYETDQVVSITSGYHDNAFNYEDTKRAKYRKHTVRNGIVHDGDYWMSANKKKPGVIGMTYEFGRPGKSTPHHRNSPKMKQVRNRIPNRTDHKSWKNRKNWKEAVPTEVEISKGTIQPVPHIRKGFDNKVEEAARLVINAVENELDRLGE